MNPNDSPLDSTSPEQVAQTNDYSIASKASLIQRGYVLDDPFLEHFHQVNKTRRSPIIHRGYFVRNVAIRYGFERMLAKDMGNVVITLGAGFDTSSFRYPNVFFIEIDYPNVVRRKMEGNKLYDSDACQSLQKLNESSNQTAQIVYATNRYILIGADLKNCDSLMELLRNDSTILERINKFFPNHFNVILFNECSLCYIEQSIVDRMLVHLMQVIIQQYRPKMVKYLGFEMYSSRRCQNGFKPFMLAHFSSLNAGILTFLDEHQIEQRFKQTLHFDQVQVVNMMDFWHDHWTKLNGEELARIDKLEPFDEWEELDQVCSVYALTLAERNGDRDDSVDSSTKVPQEFAEETHRNDPFLRLLSQSSSLCIYSHASCQYSASKNVYIFGGFGCYQPLAQGHRRLNSVFKLSLNQNQAISIDSLEHSFPDRSSPLIRSHCQAIALSGSDDVKFLLLGGRLAPGKVVPNQIVRIVDDVLLSESTPLCPSSSDLSAYRHVCHKLPGTNKIIQFGGLTSAVSTSVSSTYYDHVYEFDLDGQHGWTASDHSTNTPTLFSRHSMASTLFQDHSLLVHGGLAVASCSGQSDFDPIHVLDFRQAKLEQFSIDSLPRRLYGHRMCMVNEYQVALLGGVSPTTVDNRIRVVDTRCWRQVEQASRILQQQQPEDLLIMTNFTVHPLEDGRFLTIGGGGNCFSFGTHFNKTYLFEGS